MVGIVVTVIQFPLSSKSDAELKGSINEVRTKQPHQVTVNVPPPVAQILPAPPASPLSKPAEPERRQARKPNPPVVSCRIETTVLESTVSNGPCHCSWSSA